MIGRIATEQAKIVKLQRDLTTLEMNDGQEIRNVVFAGLIDS